MNDVLFEYLHQFCQIYINDIIIYSKTLKKHKQHVQLVLHRLQETDFQMNINKCKFLSELCLNDTINEDHN